MVLVSSFGFGFKPDGPGLTLPNAHATQRLRAYPAVAGCIDRVTSVEADVYWWSQAGGCPQFASSRRRGRHNSAHVGGALPETIATTHPAHGGKVYPGYDGVFFLMIDFKSGADETYATLIKTLNLYREMLHTANNPDR